MSFPRLKLDGNIGLQCITELAVEYDNAENLELPAYITRNSYTTKRETKLSNVASGTAQRFTDLRFDKIRLIHMWSGYVDVITESVAITSLSTEQDIKNVALIKTAMVLAIPTGVPHTIKYIYRLGPALPSLAGVYNKGFDLGLDWVYKVDKDTPEATDFTEYTTNLWIIKSITIDDQGNNTSRVTFNLEFVEPWQSIADIIDFL